MIRAVLFDRDGTLIADAAHADDAVDAMPHAASAVRRLREHGMRIGVVTNQPVLSQGAVTRAQLDTLHSRIEALVGAIDGWFVCPHEPRAQCGCRKPAPGLIHAAAREFGVSPRECIVIGDIGSDVEAALCAGAHAVLVPTPVTRAQEIESAPVVCADLASAVDYVLALNARSAA